MDETANEAVYPVRGESDRQAIASLGGYSYQLLATALAWVDLPEGGRLYLEVAEDYAVALAHGLTAIQVKRSAGTVSLGSEDVRKAIGSFVRLTQLNQGLVVRLTFLTTATPGKGRRNSRVGGRPGLLAWQEIADGNGSAEAMRSTLLSLDLGPEALGFIRSRDGEELRRDLIRRIEWRCGALDGGELRRTLGKKVAQAAYKFDVPHDEGELLSDHVIQHVLETCLAQESDRILTRATLDELLKRVTPVSIPRSTYNQMVAVTAEVASNISGRASDPASILDPHLIGERLDLAAVLGSPVDQPPVSEPFTSRQAEAVCRTLGIQSQQLLQWPTTIQGRWLERPELAEIQVHLPSPKPIVLLGSPGSGKSALMAKLGAVLSRDGAVLLAIKADALPRDVKTLTDLGRALDVPGRLDECLVRLSLEARVVLLIDQLDALADLMDQHGGRLSALLSLVAAVRDRPNIAVIVSSREFEFRNDARLTSLDTHPVRLALPSWESVSALLAARGFRPAEWEPGFHELLRTPQHLEIFLDHLAGSGVGVAYSSYQDMLETVLQRRIVRQATGREDVLVLHAVAKSMVVEEELWVPAARFDDRAAAIQRLMASGFLVSQGRRIGFRHQTLFDFVRARAFAATGESLAEYTLERQGTVFARPTIWSALSYLRGADPPRYERELRQLWQDRSLRQHMRSLLRNFVGQQASPTDGEARLVLPQLRGEEASPLLQAMRGSPGWFDRVQTRLPDLMRHSETSRAACAVLLRSVIRARTEAVLSLIGLHWIIPSEARRVSFILDGLGTWTEAAADTVDQLAPVLGNYDVLDHARAMADRLPHRVIPFIRRRFDAVLATACTAESPKDELRTFLLQPAGFHGLGSILARTPAESVRGLWDWFEAVAEKIVHDYPHQARYRGSDEAMLYELDDPPDTSDQPGLAFGRAIVEWAHLAPDDFVTFALQKAETDLQAMHILLVQGFEAIASERPSAVLEYLLGDGRRLRLGTLQDSRSASISLITAVSPALRPEELTRLVAATSQVADGWELATYEPTMRFKVSKWIREERLRLLQAIPQECRGCELARYVREEMRALDDPAPRVWLKEGLMSVPRMNAAAMAKAKNRDILRFIGQRPIGRTSRQEGPWGRADDASHQFAEFAKLHPKRALHLISFANPGTGDRVVARALSAMSQHDSIPAHGIVQLVVQLDMRGFSTASFRDAASHALIRAGQALGGLDDATCSMLVGWLKEPDQIAEAAVVQTKKDEQGFQSLLWGSGHVRLMPGGAYPTLLALAIGFLNREHRDPDSWLAVLESQLALQRNPEVWLAIADELRFLRVADRVRSVAFVKRLFEECPELCRSIQGARLMAWTHTWLPPEFVQARLEAWVEGAWDLGAQAAGELAALRVLGEHSGDVHARIEVELTNYGTGRGHPGFVRGVATTMAAMWVIPSEREAVTPWMTRLIAIADERLASALKSIFRALQGKPWDEATQTVLTACNERLAMLACDTFFLPTLLAETLRDGMDPALVGDLALGMVAGVKATNQNAKSLIDGTVTDMFELSTALQRYEDGREAGMALFEALLDADAYAVEERLAALDRNRAA